MYLRRDRKNRRGAPYVGGVDGSYIVDIIKFSLDLRDNRRIRWYRSYNARHRCPLFVDIVQVNWSLGRCWRSSPGSDSTMSHIMLRPPSPSFAPASSRFSPLLINLAGARAPLATSRRSFSFPRRLVLSHSTPWPCAYSSGQHHGARIRGKGELQGDAVTFAFSRRRVTRLVISAI